MTLPFPADPPIRCYLHHAYSTGILCAIGRLSVAEERYTNLELRQGDPFSGEGTFLDFTPYVDIGTLAGEVGITIADTVAADVLRSNVSVLGELLATALAKGEWILVYIDLYFAPWSSHYSRAHHTSQHLLVSFEQNQFVGANYRADSTFGPCKLTPEALWLGLMHQARSADSVRNLKIIRTLRFEKAEPRDQAIITDPLANLKCFWESNPSLGQRREHRYLYGEACYFGLTDEIRQRIDQRQLLDLRRTRLVYERSWMLARLLQKVLPNTGATPAWETDWQRVIALFQSAHLAAFHYNSRIATSVDVAATFDRAAEAEKRFYDEYIVPLASNSIMSHEK